MTLPLGIVEPVSYPVRFSSTEADGRTAGWAARGDDVPGPAPLGVSGSRPRGNRPHRDRHHRRRPGPSIHGRAGRACGRNDSWDQRHRPLRLLCGPVPDRGPGLSGNGRSTGHILSPGRHGVSRCDGLGLLLLGSQGAAQGATVLTGTVTIDGAPAPQFTVVQAALADGTIVGTSATGLPGFSAGQYRIDVQVSPAVDGRQVTFSVQGATVSPAVTATLRSHRVVRVDIAALTGAPVATATATPRPTATPQPTVTPEPTATPRPTATPQPGCHTGADGYAVAHIDPALYDYLRIAGPFSNGDLGGYWRGDCDAALRPSRTVDAGWLAIGLIAPGLFLGRSRFGRHK